MFMNVGEESKAERRNSAVLKCQWQAGGFMHIGGRGQFQVNPWLALLITCCVVDHQEDRGVIITDFNKYSSLFCDSFQSDTHYVRNFRFIPNYIELDRNQRRAFFAVYDGRTCWFESLSWVNSTNGFTVLFGFLPFRWWRTLRLDSFKTISQTIGPSSSDRD